MQPEQMILPTIATLALGTALLVPLRDDRLGKRATVGGVNAPLRPNFGAVLGAPVEAAAAPIVEEPVVASHAIAPESEAAHEPLAADDVEDFHAVQKAARPDFRAAFETFGARVREFFTAPPKPELLDAPHVAFDDDAPDLHEREPLADEHVTERSFADTLGSLLPLHAPELAADVPSRPQPPTAAADPEPPAHVIAADDVRKSASLPAFDRVVPLTRMPLRPQAREIAWPLDAPNGHALVTESDRHAYLAAAVRSADPALESILIAAYREEDAAGRLLALRALRSAACPDASDIYADALHVGTDDERSFAVDALLALGRREAVTSVFNDRVDAIAAQAALGYVGTYERADYARELAPFVDPARVEVILALLAGIVE